MVEKKEMTGIIICETDSILLHNETGAVRFCRGQAKF
jgi:hypothetical protein